MSDPPASCSICHSQPHKYRCPSHPTVLTCSLPCYKKHQSRASCNGKRNATTYVKKSHLTTPSGFDHDYNFLTKIEQGLKAPKAIVQEFEERPAKRRKMGATGVDLYCQKHDIMVERAPPRFQRGQQNGTRMLKRSKKVMWTVEWVDERGKKLMGTMIEDEVLEEAHKKPVWDGPTGKTVESKGAAEDIAATAQQERETSVKEETRSSASPDSHPIIRHVPVAQDCEDSTSQKSPGSATYFYLHLPRCLTSKTVLIALEASSTITDSLRGRQILEFPTIYALPHRPKELPDNFLTEVEYKKQLAKEYNEVDVAQIVRSVQATVGRKGALDGGIFGAQAKKEEVVDKERILEMLRRDLQG